MTEKEVINNLAEEVKKKSTVNPAALDKLASYLIRIHKRWSCQGNLIARFKKISLAGEFYSTMAELHSLYLLNDKFLDQGKEAFFLTEKNNPDVQIIDKNQKKLGKTIEIKAIDPPPNWRYQTDFFSEISKLQSGKTISIKMKNELWKENFDQIKSIFHKQGVCEIDTEKFEVKIIRSEKKSEKTKIIGSALSIFEPSGQLKKKLQSKLDDKPNQLIKADIILFYFYDPSFDNEDIKDACDSIKGELYKKDIEFLWVDYWNQNLIRK